MELTDIHFHDCIIKGVFEQIDPRVLTFEVDYPVDWENNVYQPHKIIFTDVYEYRVEEIAFDGNISILEVNSLDKKDDYRCIEIQTNAGNRFLSYKEVSLLKND